MRITRVIAAIAVALWSAATAAAARGLDVDRTVAVNPEREAYYGDLHLHTSYSFDAYLFFRSNVNPDDAYRFARGEPVNVLGAAVRRSAPPLDFLAVTDHSEYLAVFNTFDDPDSPLSRSEIGQEVREQGMKVFGKIVDLMFNRRATPALDLDEQAVKATTQSAWKREIAAANRHYQPGRFTTFIAYEWSSMPGLQNRHRNVIFRGDQAPSPFTAFDSVNPEDLWTFLENIRAQGYEALAIPHNSNASNGLMFDWVDSGGRRIDQAYAERRAANEPLVEIGQTKGQSETHPALAANDEFSNFEIWETKAPPQGSYIRGALGRGMQIAQHAGGVNPYRYGFAGGSDFHNALSDSAENAYAGTTGASDSARKISDLDMLADRFKQAGVALPMYQTGSGYLTGVWAEQNTRESIYAALRRKETFATSGTRLKFRFFGGWDYDDGMLKKRNWVKAAYAGGVPMGGDMPAKPQGRKAPKFAIWAVKDLGGANLDRLQVVKVWIERDKHVEKIFDVALSNGRQIDPKTGKAPSVGDTVDLKTATYTNTIGAAEFSAVWRDPEFDPSVPATYYLRVLEIPTPRWSTILAAERGAPAPEGVAAIIQERGWSSPIWYTPERR